MHKSKDKEEDDLIHIKFEYDEAVNSKKDVLSSEVNFLRIIKNVKSYQQLRLKELRMKLQILRKIKEIGLGIKNLQRSVPKINIPKRIQRQEFSEIEVKDYGEDIEKELRDIQAKLNSLNA